MAYNMIIYIDNMEAPTHFSEATWNDLARNHAFILDIPDNQTNSLYGLARMNVRFWNIVHHRNSWFMGITARPTQVAIFLDKPSQTYVPGSAGLSLEEAKKRQVEDTEEVIKGQMHIGGVEQVIGDVATHARIAVISGLGGKLLHGGDYGHKSAITETLTPVPPTTAHPFVAIVGNWLSDYGLVVGEQLEDPSLVSNRTAHMRTHTLRLLVPAQE